ncbi:hypothetical protein QY96_03147 [Bacillus thermotolerans]|nr:hypothetical protein QY96_03147 [Bacillus thermotolerans]
MNDENEEHSFPQGLCSLLFISPVNERLISMAGASLSAGRAVSPQESTRLPFRSTRVDSLAADTA